MPLPPASPGFTAADRLPKLAGTPNFRGLTMRLGLPSALLLALLLPLAVRAGGVAVAANQALIDQSRQRWESSPHGPMLARILPPWEGAAGLPEPESRGAALVVRYCTQCHHLPNPAMHDRARWQKIVDRMVARMRGQGNMGKLMKEMMAGVDAPNEEERHALLDYLQRYAQKQLDPSRLPELGTRGRSFREACSQCHALPDPSAHRARDWPAVVSRMERNMAWMNRVVGSRPDPREPQLRTEDIVGYLQAHAARP